MKSLKELYTIGGEKRHSPNKAMWYFRVSIILLVWGVLYFSANIMSADWLRDSNQKSATSVLTLPLILLAILICALPLFDVINGYLYERFSPTPAVDSNAPFKSSWKRVCFFLIAFRLLYFVFPLGLHHSNYSSQLKTAQHELSQITDERQRYYKLDDAAISAAMVGNLEESKAYAHELLALAEKYHNDPWQSAGWNYGNAVHKAHTALGLVAIKENHLHVATEELLASAPEDGSPQMNSFGPNMLLAKQLLAKGEKEKVLEFFDECDQFWTVPTIWRWCVKLGITPPFESNLVF